jgi:uncharacterized protein (DUF1684 family)
LKSITLFTSLLIAGINCHAQEDYKSQVQHYRDSINAEFANPETSILINDDIPSFHGLDYFPIDEKYRVNAKFKLIEKGDTVQLKTSGTRTPLYKPYGTVTFKIDGKKCVLTVYQSVDPKRPELSEYLLLAFTDNTTGTETYGGGRYLEFNTKEMSKKMIVDFNYCFNPYCAYNHKYSCVIPPSENSLDVRIEAGAKKYHD